MASESDEIDWDAIWDEIQEALREHALEVIGRIKKAPQTRTPVVGTQPLLNAWEGGRQRIRQWQERRQQQRQRLNRRSESWPR